MLEIAVDYISSSKEQFKSDKAVKIATNSFSVENVNLTQTK